MKTTDGFYVVILLMFHVMFHGRCEPPGVGSTDICDDDASITCVSQLQSANRSSFTKKIQNNHRHENHSKSLSIPYIKDNILTRHPDEQILVHLGSAITLTCQVMPETRVLGKFKWIKVKPLHEIRVLSEGGNVRRENRFKLTLNESYYIITIRHSRATDTGTYDCRLGKSSYLIQRIHVNVIVEPAITNIEPYSRKYLHSSKPNVRMFKKNEQLILVCFVKGYPPPYVTWIRLEGQTLPKSSQLILQDNISTLIIPEVKIAHAGKYACYANNSLGQSTEQMIEVVVQFKPSIIALKNDVRTDLYEKFVNLSCKVNAIPNATVKWLKDGVHIGRSSDKKHLRFPVYCSEDGIMKYVVTIMQLRDYGNYTCIATNPLGENKSTILLSARPLAPIIISDFVSLRKHEYRLQWRLNTTYRLPPVKMFSIQYRLNAPKTEWIYREYFPAIEETRYNILLTGLRRNATYSVLLQTVNPVNANQRGDIAFFTFKTSDEHKYMIRPSQIAFKSTLSTTFKLQTKESLDDNTDITDKKHISEAMRIQNLPTSTRIPSNHLENSGLVKFASATEISNIAVCLADKLPSITLFIGIFMCSIFVL